MSTMADQAKPDDEQRRCVVRMGEFASVEYDEDSSGAFSAYAEFNEQAAARYLAERDVRRDAVRWIRCSERMPPIGQPVLAVAHGRVQRECWIWTGARWEACVDDGYEGQIFAERDTITHWQPLPDPPEAG